MPSEKFKRFLSSESRMSLREAKRICENAGYKVSESKARKLNEAANLKAGDLAFYDDDDSGYNGVGLMIVGSLNGDMGGYLATSGGMLGVYTPKNVDKFDIMYLDTCCWIDSDGKVDGKYPIRKFNGSWDEFLDKCEEYLDY